MVEVIPVVNILKEKKGSLKEAHLVLFEYCNLRCSFCHQDHESKIGIDSIMEKVETLIATTPSTDKYVINITGGELFVDEIDDSLFEVYFAAAKRLFEYFDDPLISFGTNLVYEKYERVARLLDSLKVYGRVTLSTSYDPAGRFNQAGKKLFFQNLEKMKDYISTVNVVITKQNIETFLDGREGPEFQYLCNEFTVCFDHYIPSELYNQHQPSEDLIGKLYVKLNEKYPNSYPIKDWKENVFNPTTCRSTKIINKDGVVTTCWSEAGKGAILDESEGLIAKDEAELNFLEHYDCFSCEYYQRCTLRCFLHHSVVDKPKECQIKLMFDAIL